MENETKLIGSIELSNIKLSNKQKFDHLLVLPQNEGSYILRPDYEGYLLDKTHKGRRILKLDNISEVAEYEIGFGRINGLEKEIKEGKLSQEQIINELNKRGLVVGIYDDKVSRNHFEVGYEPEMDLQPSHFYVKDCKSSNGTGYNGIYYDINGKKEEGKFMLTPNDQISLPEKPGESARILFGSGNEVIFGVKESENLKKNNK